MTRVQCKPGSEGSGGKGKALHKGIVLLLGAFLAHALTAAAQQNAPSVAANVDDVANMSQRRPLVPPTYQGTATPAPEDFYKAQLVPGSLLSMDVYGVPELSGLALRLDVEGNVTVPTLGPVHLGGLTVIQAQDAVAKALVAGEILVAPNVKLNVVQFAAEYVSVLGEVQSPGRFQLIAARSLADVLALAGGETLAAGEDIEIQRAPSMGSTSSQAPAPEVNVQHIHYTQRDPISNLRNVSVNPGDSVFVRRAGVVYVLGAVNRPGGYLMVNSGSLNIYQALSLAGGTTLDAAKNGMYIIRPHDEVFEQIKVPFAKLAKERQTDVQLQWNDVLYIPRSGLRVAFLDGSAIIGAAVNGAIYSAR